MTQLRLEKRANYLVPSLAEDESRLSKIKHGEIITVNFKKERNAKFHRKFFALIQIIVEFDERYTEPENVLHLMKLKLGHYHNIVNTDGRVIYKPKSISFAAMDQIEFEAFYDKAVNKVLSDFLPNWNLEDLERVALDVISKF